MITYLRIRLLPRLSAEPAFSLWPAGGTLCRTLSLHKPAPHRRASIKGDEETGSGRYKGVRDDGADIRSNSAHHRAAARLRLRRLSQEVAAAARPRRARALRDRGFRLRRLRAGFVGACSARPAGCRARAGGTPLRRKARLAMGGWSGGRRGARSTGGSSAPIIMSAAGAARIAESQNGLNSV